MNRRNWLTAIVGSVAWLVFGRKAQTELPIAAPLKEVPGEFTFTQYWEPLKNCFVGYKSVIDVTQKPFGKYLTKEAGFEAGCDGVIEFPPEAWNLDTLETIGGISFFASNPRQGIVHWSSRDSDKGSDITQIGHILGTLHKTHSDYVV